MYCKWDGICVKMIKTERGEDNADVIIGNRLDCKPR